MQYTDQRPTDPLTLTCYMAEDGLANYTLYEDDGATFAYQNGNFAETSIACRVIGSLAIVEIEERFATYRPQREWYEVIVLAGGRTLQRRVRAGQGKLRVRLGR
jgi:alpha-glucosidase